MSYYQDIFDIAIRGKKSNVIRMLNAAICNVGTGDIIVDGDDLETINRKIKDEDGQHGLTVSMLDLVDEQGLQEPWLHEKKLEYEKRIEEGNPDYDGRIIDILEVSEKDDEYEVELEYYIGEEAGDFSSSDWVDSSDIARLYGCMIVYIDNESCNGGPSRINSVIIYEPTDDEASMTRITPDDDLQDIWKTFDKLIQQNPEKFRQIKIEFIEKKIRELQYEVSVEQLKIVRENLDANDGKAVIPEGIESIGSSAFAGCKNLKSIVLPASLKDFHLSAFDNTGLESIEIHPDNETFCSEGNCILSKDKKTLILGCRASVIPASVTLIDKQAFSQRHTPEEIVIPSNVKRVEEYAYSHCPDLKSVVISDGVEELGFMAFGYCPELESVSFPENMKFIGSCVFQGSPCLEELQAKYPELFEEIPEVEPVKDGDVEECPDMTNENPLIDENGHAIIPEGATEIEACQFEHCRGLVSIEIPNSVTAIRYGAFFGCAGLTRIVIPESVKEIDEFSFGKCTSLIEAIVPKTVKLDYDAFDGCPCKENFEERYM